MSKLNDQQLQFCEEYVANGFKKTKAYMKAYKTDDRNTASCGAYRLLQDSRIIDKIKDIEGNYRIVGHDLGIDKKYIMNKIKEQLNAVKPDKDGRMITDNTAVNNAIITYGKLTGDFAPDQKKLTIEDNSLLGDVDLSKKSPEEIREIKEKILKEL